jgi:hypothetical protein
MWNSGRRGCPNKERDVGLMTALVDVGEGTEVGKTPDKLMWDEKERRMDVGNG